MTDELLAYGLAKMKQYADRHRRRRAARAGSLTMTDARWQSTIAFLRAAGAHEVGRRLREGVDARHRRQRQGPALTAAANPAAAAPVVAIARRRQDASRTARRRSRRSISRSDAASSSTLLGPSGCGKSTLLNLIAGLLAPIARDRSLGGAAPFAATGARGRRLAFVFQSPTLMPWARVDANVRLPLDLARESRAQPTARVADALALVGLAELRASSIRASCPAACRCASRSRARSSRRPTSC